MDFVNKDNYNQFEVVMQNHTSYDLEHNNCVEKAFIVRAEFIPFNSFIDCNLEQKHNNNSDYNQ